MSYTAQWINSFEDAGDEEGSEDEFLPESDHDSDQDLDSDFANEDEFGNVAELTEEEKLQQVKKFNKQFDGLRCSIRYPWCDSALCCGAKDAVMFKFNTKERAKLLA